jgi:nucleotide-binding universal stress UspA family protein
MMFKKILLAFDGSEHSRKAAKIAGEMANTMQADLWVVFAYDPIPSYLGRPNFQVAIDYRLNLGEDVMNDAIKEIGPISGKLTKEILEGSATEAILSVADVREIDLIIMGTRGHSMIQGLLLGSHSHKVVSHAKCPVLLAR